MQRLLSKNRRKTQFSANDRGKNATLVRLSLKNTQFSSEDCEKNMGFLSEDYGKTQFSLSDGNLDAENQ